MSYILDALRKSESERHQGEVPNLGANPMLIHAGRDVRPLWPYLLIGALVLNAIILVIWLGLKSGDNASASTSAIAASPDSVAAPATATSLSNSAQAAGSNRTNAGQATGPAGYPPQPVNGSVGPYGQYNPATPPTYAQPGVVGYPPAQPSGYPPAQPYGNFPQQGYGQPYAQQPGYSQPAYAPQGQAPAGYTATNNYTGTGYVPSGTNPAPYGQNPPQANAYSTATGYNAMTMAAPQMMPQHYVDPATGMMRRYEPEPELITPEMARQELDANDQARSNHSPTNPQTLASLTAETPAIDVARLEDMPLDFQRRVPPLTFNSHIFASDPSARRVMINNLYLREGQQMDGMVVQEITETGVILVKDGVLFEVNASRDWVSP